ncbi:MAG: DUF3298 and DUF4163 domain-containing protein [Lachnospiraceae bacterium]|nr:DUF3298 and DUF4163 domain-containing protein [Lachnospiraceae bacterium]
MKRPCNTLLLAAIASTALICSSCGNRNDLGNNNPTTDEMTQVSDDKLLSDATTESNDMNATEDENKPADEAVSDDGKGDGVSIETKSFEDKETAEDGTLIYERSYDVPTVTIAGNEAASEKINADLQSRIDAFTASEQMKNDAREFYEVAAKEDFTFMEYVDSLGFGAARADTNVISFVITTYSFTGGAHGLEQTFGINYDAVTGELIDFADLSDDPDKFYNDTLEYNKELAQTDEYKERMFEADFLEEDALENVLYADKKWYLSDEGLVFISNPYELGPYAAGIIEFTIPYSELSGMGLKEDFNYAD